MKILILTFVFFYALHTNAQLVVSVLTPKIVGQKMVVKLELNNQFSSAIESARATCFIMDKQGKMLGQATHWVIGSDKNRPALEPKSKTMFYFVVASRQHFTTTNVVAQIAFSQLTLAGGIATDIKRIEIKTSKE